MSIEIIRKKGKYKNKYGIYLENLPGYCQQVLIDNPLSRSSFENDDQFTQVIFKMTEISAELRPELCRYLDLVLITLLVINVKNLIIRTILILTLE